MLQVYLDPCTVNSRKVLTGLDLLGTKYELHQVSYLKGEQKSPEYKKINPCATIPAAVDDTLILTESNAILQYAADLVGNPAYPKDLKQRAFVNRWLFWEGSVWFQSCYIYLVEYVVKPLLGNAPDQATIDAAAPRWNELAGVLNDQLGKTKYVAGDELTIADIAVAAPMHLHRAQKLPLDQYPNLQRWMIERIETLPSWQKTQAGVESVLLPGSAISHTAQSEVRTILNYTKESDKPTEIYFYEDEASKDAQSPGDDAQEVSIHSGWHRVKDFSIDKQGFQFSDFRTGFSNWEDDEAVKQNFYPEVVDFLKTTVGAKRVLVFDHTIRTKSNAEKKLTEEKNTSQRAPVMLVHCDYTAESGPERVRQLLGSEAEDLLSRRVAFINVWKPIHNKVEERPLAMCDVTSSPTKDFVKLILHYRDRIGENYVMRYSPDHKWWYFPGMTTDQVIMLKTYESENDGRARFVGHSAFEDPTSRPDAPIRESVEIRTIAFF